MSKRGMLLPGPLFPHQYMMAKLHKLKFQVDLSAPTFPWGDPFSLSLSLGSAVGSPAPEAGPPPAAARSPSVNGKGGWAAGDPPACTQ